MRSSNRFRSRRGYLMLDLMIVMTLTAVVLSTTSIWVYKTMQYSSAVGQRDDHARNISRISRQLRFDIRDAKTISAEANQLTIQTGPTGEPQTIEYSIDANRIHREATGGSQTHHDDFKFAKNAKLEWNRNQSDESVTLDIGRDFSRLSASKKKPSRGLDAQILLGIAGESK